jgi:DNA-binding SARP family transcriptional activator
MGVGVLGPLRVEHRRDDVSPRDRVVLSVLAMRAGELVCRDALGDALWGDELPASWTKVVQGCVVRLRKRLGAGAIERDGLGYRLLLADDELDHRVFEQLVQCAGRDVVDGEPARACRLAHQALALWRGPALAELDHWAPAQPERARLDALRLDAEDVLLEAEIRCGRSREVLSLAESLILEAPLREHRWVLLVRALREAGRRPEALEAVARARRLLVAELGIGPGRELVGIELELLRHDADHA